MIPNIFHFCFGLAPDADFSFLDYLAIRSAYELNRPERIYLHHQYECPGPWWEKSKEMVTLNRVEAPTEIFGRRIHHFAHRADVLRLMVLKEHGGIYLDIDTLCLRPFTPLLGHRCVMAWQGSRGLCNAVILSEPDGEFVRAWLDSFRSFRSVGKDQFWDEHAVVVPGRLARERRLRPQVTTLDHRAFFFPLWDEMHHLFESSDPAVFQGSYCLHYWESVTFEKWLSRITPENAVAGNTNFARFARRALGCSRPEDDVDLQTAASTPAGASGRRRGIGVSLGVTRAVRGLGTGLRWLSQQSRHLVWVPTLLRNVGWAAAPAYVVYRLRLTARRAKSPFVLLRSKGAAHPLRCGPRCEDLAAFDQVFVLRQYECLDDAENVELIVDCGANVGYASAYLLTRFPAARLIALEPDPDNFEFLQANLAPYGERCQTLCSAVWPHPVPLVFEETDCGEGRQWRRRVRPARADEVPSVTALDLGTVLKESGLQRISILRMNIGGAESAVFASDYEPWLEKVNHLAIELHGDACRSALLSAISSRDYVLSGPTDLVGLGPGSGRPAAAGSRRSGVSFIRFIRGNCSARSTS